MTTPANTATDLRGGAPRWITLASLMLAGEAIFGLPFHVSRYFRPAFVDVFGVSQTELGWMGSLYGMVATASYLLGGRLADRFAAKHLLCFSLVVTGLSGIYMGTIPAPTGLGLLYAFWGVSTILPFWSALIRATRDWGGADRQGATFGMLDAGRGLLAAVLATFALFAFTAMLPGDAADVSLAAKTSAIRITIATYVVACFVAAIMVWWFLPGPTVESRGAEGVGARAQARSYFAAVLRMPVIWLQATVIIGAYCAFKGIDYYSQYAKDIWGWSDVQASTLSTLSSWVRPVATVGAGLVADRFRPSRTVIAGFALVAIASFSMVAMAPPGQPGEDGIAVVGSPLCLLWGTIMLGCVGIFALRGIYFALLEEALVPMHVTGTAVGVVSFLGYTPEIFMPIIGGLLLDHWEGGIEGYQALYGLVVLACLVGTIAAWRIHRTTARLAPPAES